MLSRNLIDIQMTNATLSERCGDSDVFCCQETDFKKISALTTNPAWYVLPYKRVKTIPPNTLLKMKVEKDFQFN